MCDLLSNVMELAEFFFLMGLMAVHKMAKAYSINHQQLQLRCKIHTTIEENIVIV